MLWLGQVVSQMGDWFNTIALYTIILNLTGSGREIGLVDGGALRAQFCVWPDVGGAGRSVQPPHHYDCLRPAAGPRRIGLSICPAGRSVMDHLHLLTVLQLALSTFFEPAKTAVIPSIVSDRELVAANAISSVTWSVMLTLGAAIGGVITGWFGTDVSFVLDAFTYLLSAALIASVRLPKRPPREKRKLTFSRALGITADHRGGAICKTAAARAGLVAGETRMGTGWRNPDAAGSFRRTDLSGSQQCGSRYRHSFRGAWNRHCRRTNRRAPDFRRRQETHADLDRNIVSDWRRRAIWLSAALRILWWPSSFLGVAHTGGSILWVFSTVLLQRGVEDNFRGRVFAAELALLTLTMAVSNYATGELLDRFGLSPRVVTIGIGAFFLLPGVAWFLTQKWWDQGTREPIPEIVYVDSLARQKVPV